MRNAWVDGEEPLVDESKFTPWAEPGWEAWNAFSPERRFCEALGELAGFLGGVVFETGAGQGYSTRRVAEQAEFCHVYESDASMRKVIPKDDDRFYVEPEPSFAPKDLTTPKLLILDSSLNYRLGEILAWWQHGTDDSICVIHDAGNGHEGRGMNYTHNHHLALIRQLGLTGIHYKNPRGSFLAWKREPDTETMEFFKGLLPN